MPAVKIFTRLDLNKKSSFSFGYYLAVPGFRCGRLVFPPAQLELFPDNQPYHRKRSESTAALDTIRERFGRTAVRFGGTPAAA